MEQYDQSQYATQMSPQKHSHKSLWFLLLLLILAAGACFGIYQWQHNKLSQSESSLSDAKAQVAKLTAAQKTYQLPGKSDFGPECSSKDNVELVSAALTPQPVDNYQAYMVACAGDNSTPVRVMAFKVNDDGSRSFAYGAGTGEPLCISSKIMDATAANDISKQTGIPICKTF